MPVSTKLSKSEQRTSQRRTLLFQPWYSRAFFHAAKYRNIYGGVDKSLLWVPGTSRSHIWGSGGIWDSYRRHFFPFTSQTPCWGSQHCIWYVMRDVACSCTSSYSYNTSRVHAKRLKAVGQYATESWIWFHFIESFYTWRVNNAARSRNKWKPKSFWLFVDSTNTIISRYL